MSRTAMRQLEKMAHGYNVKDFKWINPKTIPVRHWVRAKCLCGCWRYGKWATCPPELPSVAECEKYFKEYQIGLFIHLVKKFEDPEKRHEWSREVQETLLALEKEVFLSGYYKAFVFPPSTCCLCESCTGKKAECRHPFLARPNLEGFCVDVYATARKMGYPIQVLKNYEEETNRYALLLVE